MQAVSRYRPITNVNHCDEMDKENVRPSRLRVPVSYQDRVQFISGFNENTSCADIVRAFLIKDGCSVVDERLHDYALFECYQGVERQLDNNECFLPIFWLHAHANGIANPEVVFGVRMIESALVVANQPRVATNKKRSKLRVRSLFRFKRSTSASASASKKRASEQTSTVYQTIDSECLADDSSFFARSGGCCSSRKLGLRERNVNTHHQQLRNRHATTSSPLRVTSALSGCENQVFEQTPDVVMRRNTSTSQASLVTTTRVKRTFIPKQPQNLMTSSSLDLPLRSSFPTLPPPPETLPAYIPDHNDRVQTLPRTRHDSDDVTFHQDVLDWDFENDECDSQLEWKPVARHNSVTSLQANAPSQPLQTLKSLVQSQERIIKEQDQNIAAKSRQIEQYKFAIHRERANDTVHAYFSSSQEDESEGEGRLRPDAHGRRRVQAYEERISSLQSSIEAENNKLEHLCKLLQAEYMHLSSTKNGGSSHDADDMSSMFSDDTTLTSQSFEQREQFASLQMQLAKGFSTTLALHKTMKKLDRKLEKYRMDVEIKQSHIRKLSGDLQQRPDQGQVAKRSGSATHLQMRACAEVTPLAMRRAKSDFNCAYLTSPAPAARDDVTVSGERLKQLPDEQLPIDVISAQPRPSVIKQWPPVPALTPIKEHACAVYENETVDLDDLMSKGSTERVNDVTADVSNASSLGTNVSDLMQHAGLNASPCFKSRSRFFATPKACNSPVVLRRIVDAPVPSLNLSDDDSPRAPLASFDTTALTSYSHEERSFVTSRTKRSDVTHRNNNTSVWTSRFTSPNFNCDDSTGDFESSTSTIEEDDAYDVINKCRADDNATFTIGSDLTFVSELNEHIPHDVSSSDDECDVISDPEATLKRRTTSVTSSHRSTTVAKKRLEFHSMTTRNSRSSLPEVTSDVDLSQRTDGGSFESGVCSMKSDEDTSRDEHDVTTEVLLPNSYKTTRTIPYPYPETSL